MRIIADRKDYYDCIMASGQDMSVVYIRNPKKMKFATRKAWPFPGFLGNRGESRIIGFCGKIYGLIELNDPGKFGKTIKCFNIEHVDAFMKKHLSPRELKEYYGGRRISNWWRSLNRKHYENFFAECEKKQMKFEKMFKEQRCPIFVASQDGPSLGQSNGTIEWNAMLNKYEFFRVFDPYTAFQEIAMFVGNMAIPQDPMPVIPDKLKAESKGFNKWSFRTPPAGV